jgi:hypothetical protein
MASFLAAASLTIANDGPDKNAKPTETPAPAAVPADPLASTLSIAADVTGRDAGREIEHMLLAPMPRLTGTPASNRFISAGSHGGYARAFRPHPVIRVARRSPST